MIGDVSCSSLSIKFVSGLYRFSFIAGDIIVLFSRIDSSEYKS